MVSGRNRLVVAVEGDIGDFQRAMRQAAGEIRDFGNSARLSFGNLVSGVALGNLAAQGLTQAAGFLSAEMRASVAAASDMAESQAKLGEVFGSTAAQLEDWADTAATSMGMSRQAAIESVATFGNFMQSLGLTRAEALKMSPAIVQLAADLTSFNNANPEEVILALRSGLSGEVEPLRKFGVALSAAAVESAALKLGLAKTKDEISEGAKVAARYALIMDQTKSAQGDFARTSEGLANQQRILSAQVENVRERVGTALVPVLQDVVREMNNWLQTNGDEFAYDLAEAFDSAASAASGLAAALGEVVGWAEQVPRAIAAIRDAVPDWMQKGIDLPGGIRIGSPYRVSPELEEVNRQRRIRELQESGIFGGGEGEDVSGDVSGVFRRVPGYKRPAGVSPPRNAPTLGGSATGGGASGPKPTAFTPETLGLMQQILTGLPEFTPNALDADALAQFKAAEAQFSAIRASVNRQLAELGLRMAELDARGLETSGEFKALEDRAGGLRSALQQVDFVEDLRLNPFRDAMTQLAEATQVATDAAAKYREELQRGTLAYLQGLGQRNVRFAPGVFEDLARAGGLTPIGDFPSITDQNGNPIPRVDIVLP